jgi:hypothetical protein
MAAAAIAALIAGPGYLLWARHGAGGGEAGSTPGTALPISIDDEKTGIFVAWPLDWRRLERDGAITLQSPDRTLVISLSAPAPAREAPALRQQAVEAVRRTYADVEVRPGRGRSIDGRSAAGAVIEGTAPSGDRQRLVIAVARGRERAYLLQVFAGLRSTESTAGAGQLILNSIELSR